MCSHVSVFVCLILDAAVTVKVARVLFDGSLGDEGWVLCVTWYLHGPTHSLSWRREGREGKKGRQKERNKSKKVMATTISSQTYI